MQFTRVNKTTVIGEGTDSQMVIIPIEKIVTVECKGEWVFIRLDSNICYSYEADNMAENRSFWKGVLLKRKLSWW